jgi:hypothetical protein
MREPGVREPGAIGHKFVAAIADEQAGAAAILGIGTRQEGHAQAID